jgi:hypothetical protein
MHCCFDFGTNKWQFFYKYLTPPPTQDRIAWAFQKDSPYSQVFSNGLTKMRETGIINRLVLQHLRYNWGQWSDVIKLKVFKRKKSASISWNLSFRWSFLLCQVWSSCVHILEPEAASWNSVPEVSKPYLSWVVQYNIFTSCANKPNSLGRDLHTSSGAEYCFKDQVRRNELANLSR